MNFSKIKALLIFPSLILAAPAVSAVELLKRHRYEEAASIWVQDIKTSPMDEKGMRALKGLSLAYEQLGSFYAHMHEFSLALQGTYFEGVLSEVNSPLTHFYLGQIHYLNGDGKKAQESIENALKVPGAKIPEYHEVFLAFSKNRPKNSVIPTNFSKKNTVHWQALDLAESLPANIPVGMVADSPRSRRCQLSILSRSIEPRIEEVTRLLSTVIKEAEEPEISQDPGKNTQISFYDPYLLETLSRTYLALSKWYQLKLLTEEKKFPDLAKKFSTRRGIAEVCLALKQETEAMNYLDASDDSQDNKIVKAKILGKQGKVADAKLILETLAKGPKDPALYRDLADAYNFLSIDLDKAEALALKALRDRNGANYYRVHASIFMKLGQVEKAAAEYAKGYKIEFRNRIDQIDPEYMAEYSYAIFMSSKMRYEEIVETLYHLQKEFPTCRQMHNAMQGISASSARGYEVNKILRKGG